MAIETEPAIESASEKEPAGANPKAVDLRHLIPKLGLTEYWYPAVLDRKVGRRKPVMVKMLGEDLCFFRGADGQVVALNNACPHRGAMLSEGSCDFRGSLTCSYHGMVFDEHGECLAALGEGPLSAAPGSIHARAYPTVTLKGLVFVWMGQGEPWPLDDSIPEEFFDHEAQIFNWMTYWPCNWRRTMENVGDSHVRVVHRNSILMLMRPITSPGLPRRGRIDRVGTHRLGTAGARAEVGRGSTGDHPYQDYYPKLGAKWPHHRWRLLWTWFFDWTGKQKFRGKRKPYKLSEEWGPGQHLPSIVRINYGTHVYTRWVVPVADDLTRIYYFHAAKRPTWLGRLHEVLHWHVFHNWAMNRNFSEQDARGAIKAYFDAPENLVVSDMQAIAWRKMVLSARGIRRDPRVAT